ncbi:MAG: SDR family oxidoreductase [Chloroflexota bacterium]
MLNTQLEGQVALITGANHGIGAATARALAAQGASVFITYYLSGSLYTQAELDKARSAGVGGEKLYAALSSQAPDQLIADIRAGGRKAAAQPFDLAEVANVEKLFDLCEAELGSVDILIINHTHDVLVTFDPALVSSEQGVVKLISAEEIDRHFAINTRASALLMREFLARHIKHGHDWGRIVTLSTVFSHAWNVSYAASKRALVSYSQSAAEEMGKYGVTVNAVCPGPTQTGYITPESESHLVRDTPLGRLGHPEDIADVITFLASDQGRWMTGQVIYATGGFMMYPS